MAQQGQFNLNPLWEAVPRFMGLTEIQTEYISTRGIHRGLASFRKPRLLSYPNKVNGLT